MSSITLHLPVPPSVNGLYFNLPGRGRVRTRAYREWVRNADAHLMAQKRPAARLTGPLELLIKIPRYLRGDISNRIKALEDYLVSREITGDDRHNARVVIERADVADCEVELHPLDGGAA
jgi:Holliday junction resolvase RusA-like endonuclease